MTPDSSSVLPRATNGAFPATQWSMVLYAGAGDDTRAQVAMEKLCRQYWYPLYAFVRRQGRSHHEAEDCTQEFLVRLLASDGVARARRERGRFRTFLLAGLRNFLTNEWHRARAEKRGGGQTTLSFDVPGADERFAQEAADAALTPDQAYDRSWANGLIEAAIAALGADYEQSGRHALFKRLVPLLWGNDTTVSLAAHAVQLAMTEQAFTVALHRLRRRVGERLRIAVAETVADGTDVDRELRYLIAAVSTRPANA